MIATFLANHLETFFLVSLALFAGRLRESSAHMWLWEAERGQRKYYCVVFAVVDTCWSHRVLTYICQFPQTFYNLFSRGAVLWVLGPAGRNKVPLFLTQAADFAEVIQWLGRPATSYGTSNGTTVRD